MNKEEYNKQKQEIIDRLGKPEYDNSVPSNDSAKELSKLRSQHLSEIATEKRLNRAEMSQAEQSDVVEEARPLPSIPLYLSEADLAIFKPEERDLLVSYFENTNITPKQLNHLHPKLSTQKIVAFLRSGPVIALSARVWDHTTPMAVKWALLKLVHMKNAKIVERLGENFGLLKSQETTLNINKPIDINDVDLIAKLKELGDNQSESK